MSNMFSLPFKLRRKSEADHAEGTAPLARVSSAHSAKARSQSHGGKALSRTLSNSLSKRLSFFSNNSSDDLNSVVSSQSELATQELTRFKTMNHDRFPREVLQYLKFQGLSAPSIVEESPTVRIAVAATGENVFLPSLIALSEEEQHNLEQHSPNPISDTTRPTANPDPSQSTVGSSATADTPPTSTAESSLTGNTVLQESQPIQTHIDDSVDPISHTFAVVVTLQKPTAITNIKAQLQATCSINWPKGLPSDRSIKREDFELGQASWELNIANYNFFVPLSENAIDDDDEWNYDDVDPDMDESKFLTEQKIQAKRIELRSFDQVTRGGYLNHKRDHDPFVLGSLNGQALQYPAGNYVFLLPTLFDPSIPETVLTTKSHVSYSLRTIVAQKGKVYNFGEHYVPIIRGPPVSGITTADKPIFVSKVWNDTLSYEISFPKKYVTLGSELPFKLKFVPLEKKVTVKRIKVNVIEKVTYVSKSLEFEYDEHGNADDEAYLQTNGNEKIIPLLEVRTKARNSRAVREEVVDDAAVFDNLLSCCYEADKSDPNPAEKTEIVGPLSISTHLPFIKPQKPVKLYPHTSKQFIQTVVSTDKGKPQATRELRTRISNQNYSVNTTTRINTPEDGLTPDSLNNRYINIEHKLQICVRISRHDSTDGKVHHYEVIIDTPIFVLNGACVPESVELPAYAYSDGTAPVQYFGAESDRLPTFDEAVSPMNSPMLLPTHEETLDRLSRTSTLNTQALDPVYDTIDGLVNDASDLSLGSRRRRSTSTKAEMLSSFRRTLSHTPVEDPSETGATGTVNSSGSSDAVLEEESMPDNPPPYLETVALMSDESDVEDEDNGEDTFVHDQSTDLTEQFHRAVYGDYV